MGGRSTARESRTFSLKTHVSLVELNLNILMILRMMNYLEVYPFGL